MSYNTGITLGNSAYELAAGIAIDWLVTARPLNLTVGMTYDGSSSFSSGYVLSGTVNGDTTPTLSGGASTSSANAGNYTSFSSSTLALNDANYTLSGGTVAATVTARSITVTAADKSKTYGNVDPALGWSVTAGSLFGSDTLSGVLTRSAGESIGSYSIDASALANGNYLVTAHNGTLTINLAAQAETLAPPPPPPTSIPPVQVLVSDTAPPLEGGLVETGVNISVGNESVDQITTSADATGTITVSFSEGSGAANGDFSFTLSDRDAQALSHSGTPVQATLMNGEPLPAWLTFDSSTLTFVASSVPEKAFPIKLLVSNGEKQFKVIITKHAAKKA